MFQWTIFESDINITWVYYAKAGDLQWGRTQQWKKKPLLTGSKK
jgi:hypothetical protein